MMREDGRTLKPRQLLRVAALIVVGLGIAVFVRNAMKPPDARKTGALVMLITFVAANGVPLLLSLKVSPTATALRVTALLGVALDLLVVVVMVTYGFMTLEEGATSVRVRALSSSIGGALVRALALLFRSTPLAED